MNETLTLNCIVRNAGQECIVYFIIDLITSLHSIFYCNSLYCNSLICFYVIIYVCMNITLPTNFFITNKRTIAGNQNYAKFKMCVLVYIKISANKTQFTNSMILHDV